MGLVNEPTLGTFTVRDDAPYASLVSDAEPPKGPPNLVVFARTSSEELPDGDSPGTIYFKDFKPFTVTIEQGDSFGLLDYDGTDGHAAISLPAGHYQPLVSAFSSPGGRVTVTDPLYFERSTLVRSTARPTWSKAGVRQIPTPDWYQRGDFRLMFDPQGIAVFKAAWAAAQVPAPLPPLPTLITQLAGPDLVYSERLATLSATVSNPSALPLTFKWQTISPEGTVVNDNVEGGAVATWAAPPIAGTYQVGLTVDNPYFTTTAPVPLTIVVRRPERLGPFATLGSRLNTARYLHSVSTSASRLFAIGGYNWDVSPYLLDSVEVAQANSDGTLTDFAVSPSRLTYGRYGHGSAISAGNLYVVGGYNSSYGYIQDTIEYAPINPDGTLGNFVTSSSHLVTPRSYGVTVAHGSYLYVIGGYNWNFGQLNSVERAVILPDGSLGPFTQLPGGLDVARYLHTCAVKGDQLFVVGGYNWNYYSGVLPAVEKAAFNPDGTLTPFTTTSAALNTSRYGHAGAVLGDGIYVMGGNSYSGNILASVERAVVAADGSVSAFTTVEPHLEVPRYLGAGAAIGDSLYVVGGFSDIGVVLGSVEKASLD